MRMSQMPRTFRARRHLALGWPRTNQLRALGRVQQLQEISAGLRAALNIGTMAGTQPYVGSTLGGG